jgi:predicted dinucleotide-binding enzyme
VFLRFASWRDFAKVLVLPVEIGHYHTIIDYGEPIHQTVPSKQAAMQQRAQSNNRRVTQAVQRHRKIFSAFSESFDHNLQARAVRRLAAGLY